MRHMISASALALVLGGASACLTATDDLSNVEATQPEPPDEASANDNKRRPPRPAPSPPTAAPAQEEAPELPSPSMPSLPPALTSLAAHLHRYDAYQPSVETVQGILSGLEDLAAVREDTLPPAQRATLSDARLAARFCLQLAEAYVSLLENTGLHLDRAGEADAASLQHGPCPTMAATRDAVAAHLQNIDASMRGAADGEGASALCRTVMHKANLYRDTVRGFQREWFDFPYDPEQVFAAAYLTPLNTLDEGILRRMFYTMIGLNPAAEVSLEEENTACRRTAARMSETPHADGALSRLSATQAAWGERRVRRILDPAASAR